MNCRPYGRKPTIAFWMLIAIADSAVLVVRAGSAVMLTVAAGIALVAGAFLAARLLIRPRLAAPNRPADESRTAVPNRPADLSRLAVQDRLADQSLMAVPNPCPTRAVRSTKTA